MFLLTFLLVTPVLPHILQLAQDSIKATNGRPHELLNNLTPDKYRKLAGERKISDQPLSDFWDSYKFIYKLL